MKKIKVMTIFGTRPEGIKMAPLIKEMENREEFEVVFVNTAQHREIHDTVLQLFSIQSKYDLDVMRKIKMGNNIHAIGTEIKKSLPELLRREKPDIVLVHGDTTTTFESAMVSAMEKIPVGHIEAGLRTGNIHSPFPEEINRSLVGRIATYHFAPTRNNRQNLIKENVNPENIFVVGNTVIDALLEITSRPYTFQGKLKDITEKNGKILLMTTHRRENLNQLRSIYEAVNRLIEKHSDLELVFPAHPNPAVRKEAEKWLNDHPRAHVIEPLEYEAFSHLMKKTHLIISDSGGIQEEAPALGKPVLVVRDTTERPEGVKAGTLKLVGTQSETLFNETDKLLTNETAYKKMAKSINPYGIGDTSKRIADKLLEIYM